MAHASEVESQDSDFGELDELMAESQGAVAPEVDPLEALFTESVTISRETREAKEAKERLKRGGQPRNEFLADQARIKEWESKHEWEAVANASLWEKAECSCGEYQQVFQGLFTKERHRHLRDGTTRYTAASTTRANLPNISCVRVKRVAMCYFCAEDKGWMLDGDAVEEWEDR